MRGTRREAGTRGRWIRRLGRLVLPVCASAWVANTGGTAPGGLPQGDPPLGVEVARRMNERDDGAAVSRTLVMELVDRRGKKRIRETRSFRKRFEDGKKSAIFYESPRNVRGTAFLTYDYAAPEREDDQWLYLPALRKVRRISAADRGDYFLGTDLTYEDVKNETKVVLRDYTWKTVGRETVDDHPCWLLEATPVDEDVAHELGYSRVLIRVDPSIWISRKVEYWDVGGNLLKTSDVGEIRKVQEIWTPHRIEVTNHKTGHVSLFLYSDVDYETRVSDDLFTERALRRGI